MANTLLVGVGGSGCKVAQKVYNRLKSQKNTNLRYAILGVDTDTGDIQQRQQSGDGFPVVQISSNRTIFDTIEDFKSTGVDMDWLPQKLGYKVYSRSLLDGAGQLRFLSRLAIAENMQSQQSFESALNKIRDQLFSNINDINTPGNSGDVDVMIIGSIAGGTGSGVFLPIAMHLRDWFEEMGITANVRAFFLLPNVFIGRGLPKNQYDNVRANAYAALSEINAVMHAVQGNSVAKNMQFEYAPGKKLTVWDSQSEAPRAEPFHFVYLMDGHASGGRTLDKGTVDDYYRMVADTAFQLLHTPLGIKINSIEDNNVRDKNADCVAGTISSYAAVGVSGVVYPQEEVEQYLALKYSASGLSKEWLRIDKSFQEISFEYENKKRAGDSSGEEPEIGSHFIKSFNSFANITSGELFQELKRQVHVHIEDKNGNQLLEVTFDKFLLAINQKIKAEFWGDSTVNQVTTFKRLSFERLDFDKIKAKCIKAERMYDAAFNNIEKHLKSEPLSIFKTIWSSGENTKAINFEDYHLQKWLFSGVNKKEAPHPLQVRYFLYSLKQSIKEDEAVHKNLAKSAKLALEKALGTGEGGVFDDGNTDRVERASDELNTAAKQNVFKRYISGFEDDFVARYEAHSNSVIGHLNTYGNSSCKVKTYALLIKQIDAFLDVIESFFSQLGVLNEQLSKEIDTSLDKYGEGKSQGDNYIYVLADRKAKEALWHTIEQQGKVDNDNDINQTLVTKLYAFYKEQRDEVRDAFDTQKVELPGIKLFREEIIEKKSVNKVRQNFSNLYQMTAIEAIYKQQLLMQKSGELQQGDELLSKYLTKVYQQSCPFVELDIVKNEQHFSLWGLTNNNARDLKKFYPEINLSQGQADSSYIEGSEFSDGELLLFDISPGLQAENFQKFVGNGEYKQAFNQFSTDFINDLWENPGEATGALPLHLDYRWHFPGALPLIGGDRNNLLLNVVKTYIFGLGLNLFKSQDFQGQAATFYQQRLLVNNQRADDLLAEITKWPPLVEEVQQVFCELTVDEQFQYLSSQNFLLNILDLLRWEKVESVDLMLKWVLEEVNSLYSKLHPNKSNEKCFAELEKLITGLFNNVKISSSYLGLESREQTSYDEAMDYAKDNALEKWKLAIYDAARTSQYRR